MAALLSMRRQSVQKESEEQLSSKSSILCPGRTIPNSNIEYKSSFWNITRHRTDNIVSIHSASSTQTPVNQAIGTSSTAFLQSSFMVDVPEYKETLMNTYSTIPHSFKNILEETPIQYDVFTARSFSEKSNIIPTLTLKNRITSTISHSSLVTSIHSLNTQDGYSNKSEGLETYDVTEAITHEQETPKSKTTLVIPGKYIVHPISPIWDSSQGVCDKVSFKHYCLATGTSWDIENLPVARFAIIFEEK